MADLKISALTASTTPLAGTEVLPIVQSSTTKQVSVANLTAGRAVSMLSATAGNVQVSGNTVTTTDTNGNLTLNPNGSGYTVIVSATNGTIAQMGDTTSRTYYLKSANVGGFDNDTLIFESDSGVGQFQWKNSGATLWTMTAAGNLAPATAGKGVNYTANTPAAGMTSQLLNWYEEGTWTPVLSATTTPPTVSYSNRTGRYTRVGRLVTLHMWMNISSQSGGSGDVTITGLPFASANTSGAPIAAVTVGTYQNINPGVGLIMTPYIGSSSSIINLAASTQIGSGWGNMTTAALGASNINLQLTVTYIV